MTKINEILKRFDEEFGQSKVELVNCELPLEMPIILKRNIITGNVVYEELPIAVKQFLLTAIKGVLEDIEPQTFETFNENGYLVEAVDEFDFRKQKTSLLSQIDKELNK